MKIDLDLISTTFADVEFFLACVGSAGPPVFVGQDTSALAVTSTENFWAVTSTVRATGQSLVNQVGGASILFRGYEGAMSVHSYSSAPQREKLATPDRLTNGVFAYLKVDPSGQVIVRSDAFGVAPLFYRRCGDAWLFASHPGLLHFEGDDVDLTAWLSLLQNGQVLADRSFYQEIMRFPAGTQMTIDSAGAGARTERWFRFEELPAGDLPIDDKAFADVEDSYLRAMDRCLRLELDSITLPFSSGYDSRRFFGTLLQRKVPFEAVTCQTFHRKNGRDYDIDSYFAPKIAAAFGVPCELVEAVPAAGIAGDAQRRLELIGTETFMHAWSMPFMRWLAARPPSIIFDGLAGDTFGNSGFEIDGLHETPAKDVELLVKEASKPVFFQQMSALFPTRPDYAASYRDYLTQFSPNLNQAELAFLQSRTRRCISPWITMMHPPGHVVVFPYFDMEFARTTLAYHPADKYKWFFQKECLKRFYPAYFDFPGSRNLPKDHPPLTEEESLARDREADRYDYGDLATIVGALKYLNLQNKVLLLSSLVLPAVRRKRNWLFRPLLSLVRRQQQAKIFVDRGAAAGVDRKNTETTSVSSIRERDIA